MQINELLKLELPLVLASQSPRRRHLLEMLGLEFSVNPAHIDENGAAYSIPEELATSLSLKKARTIAHKLDYSAIVLGSDTIVVLCDNVLNKPENPEHAVEMLKTLSGNTHSVITGISLVEAQSGRSISKAEHTRVTFRELDEDEIRAYVAGGSPMDKAGGYGIQDDFGAVFVNRVEGCYYNIVGLPLQLFYKTLKEFSHALQAQD